MRGVLLRRVTKIADEKALRSEAMGILCALHATLDGAGAKLLNVRVRLGPTSGRHLCRLRAWFVRGDLLVVEARASTRRGAIEAAAKGLREVLAKRAADQTSSPGPSAGQSPRAELPREGRRRSASGDAPRTSRFGAKPPEGRLLLALTEAEAPMASLDWAVALAREFQIDLHVLRVLSEQAEPVLSPAGDWIDVTRDIQRILVATRETRAWCDELLPDAVSAERVCVRLGEFEAEVARRAEEVAPDMIVLSPGSQRLGDMVTTLARATQLPVLVARVQKSRCTLLAATDLEDDSYPVLRKAAALGNHLNASVVAFHNVGMARAQLVSRRSALSGQNLWLDIQKERLELAADHLLQDGEVFVAQEPDPASAIVSRARAVHADTIIVGTRPRSWADSLARKSVAAEVVEQTDRSVIVVPLSALDQAGGTSHSV
jgi:nucleotide-binding universal stress UspA family protein